MLCESNRHTWKKARATVSALALAQEHETRARFDCAICGAIKRNWSYQNQESSFKEVRIVDGAGRLVYQRIRVAYPKGEAK